METQGSWHCDDLPLLRLGAATGGFLHHESGERTRPSARVQGQAAQAIYQVEVTVAGGDDAPLLLGRAVRRRLDDSGSVRC